jgi:tricorn protease
MQRYVITAILLILFVGMMTAQPQEARLLRFPSIHGNQIAFTYAGKIYTVPATGGVARKLTNEVGTDLFPRFSPDGKWIAFTGQYDGNTEVYVMPSEGGVPKRLTFTATLGRDDVSDRMGPNNLVMGWKHDNKHIIFRSRMREFNDFNGQLYLASIEGGIPEELPLPRGGFCSYSPDDSKLAYNRIFREFRTWKRYRGGMADDVWIYDFATKKIENVTSNPALDLIPMWSGDKIYFVSDRDTTHRINLYVYDLKTKETRKLTEFTEFDIKFPSLGDQAIVFENGGFIYKFDLATEKAEKVPVMINEDLVGGRTAFVKVGDNVTNYEIAPDGKRALLGARGEIFTVPAKNGPTRNLTATPGVHERNSKWSPDGKWISYVSDATGEDEIYIMPQDGSGEPVQLTKKSDTYKYQPYWSPDSKKLLWADKKLRLRYIDIDTKAITEVSQAKIWEYDEYTWSPDSKWIAYTQPEVEGMNKVYLYSLATAVSTPVTDEWFNSGTPTFSSDGKYLFFVSDRDFNPTYGQTEFNHIYRDMSRIYLVTLTKSTESPFRPKSDEVSVKEAKPDENKSKSGDKKDKAEAGVTVKVDFDGIKDRILGLPVQPAGYRALVSVGSTLYYIRQGSKDDKGQFQMYDLDELKETNLGEVDGYEFSADHKKMITSSGRGYYIIDVPKSKIDLKDRLDLSGMEVKLDKHAEWNQIFTETWRQMRDFFYAPNMHGVDWVGVRDKYKALVPYVNNRIDLTYILGEVVGEINSGHTYVGGGEYPHAPRIATGLLGAQLEKDAKSGYFKITRILKGQNWDNGMKSPLTEMGVDAHEGDYITSVNGKSTADMVDIYEALVNTAGKQVKLGLASSSDKKNSREVTVIPIANEAQLYYYDWVEENTRKVSEATNGQVGYIHIPDMGVEGLNEFIKHFYPQLRKKALIVDDRGNGGGNVSPMITERLRREIAMMTFARNTVPTPDPDGMLVGPKVLLINEFSASDGDIFPYRFRKYHLGPIIGKRTWGGVVGIRGSLPLLDGGFVMKPEFSRYDDVTGNWVMEGHGVDPDIVVDNDPAKEWSGVDEQLNKAVDVIMDLLKTQGKTLPPIPDYPVKR